MELNCRSVIKVATCSTGKGSLSAEGVFRCTSDSSSTEERDISCPDGWAHVWTDAPGGNKDICMVGIFPAPRGPACDDGFVLDIRNDRDKCIKNSTRSLMVGVQMAITVSDPNRYSASCADLGATATGMQAFLLGTDNTEFDCGVSVKVARCEGADVKGNFDGHVLTCMAKSGSHEDVQPARCANGSPQVNRVLNRAECGLSGPFGTFIPQGDIQCQSGYSAQLRNDQPACVGSVDEWRGADVSILSR